MGVAGSDVRRVGHDHVEALRAERLTPVARREFDVVDLETSGILARDMQRRRACIRSQHARQRTLAGDGQRDRTGAGAQIGDPHGPVHGYALQRELHQQLGFRARDKDVAGNFQIERPESAMTEQIGDRLAALPRFHQLAKARFDGRIRKLVGMRVQPGPLALQRVAQQDLGFVPRFDLPGRSQLGQQLAKCRHRRVRRAVVAAADRWPAVERERAMHASNRRGSTPQTPCAASPLPPRPATTPRTA